jgi:hypothetical protein
MGKSAIFALVSVQEADRATLVTRGPFSSFWLGRVFIWSSRMGEGHAWPFGALDEPWDDTRCRFCGTEMLVDLCLSCVGGTLLLYEVSSFQIYSVFPCFELFLPSFQISKFAL